MRVFLLGGPSPSLQRPLGFVEVLLTEELFSSQTLFRDLVTRPLRLVTLLS